MQACGGVVAIRGREFLDVARQLARGSRPPSERVARTAVNRAYYAAFSEAADYVVNRGYVRKRGGASHQQLWEYLKSGIRDTDAARQGRRSAVAAHGLELLRRRTLADYNLVGRLPHDDPKYSMDLADRVVTELDRLVP